MKTNMTVSVYNPTSYEKNQNSSLCDGNTQISKDL